MSKTIKISDENQARLFELVNVIREREFKKNNLQNVSYDDAIEELFKRAR